MLAEIVAGWGHEVEACGDGPEAEDKLSTFSPQLALIDLTLPSIDGCDLAPRLAAAAPGLRMIAMSGYDQADMRARSAAAGFERLLGKPIDLRTLESLLRPAE